MSQSAPGWQFACERCRHQFDPVATVWQCPLCGSALAIKGLDQIADHEIDRERSDLWRYAAVLPSTGRRPGLLGEGMTPLVLVELDAREVYLKLDSLLPTGSFKDRGASVLARYLRDRDVRRVILDSSGNAAAAMSAFATAEGLGCTVYVPASASPGKLVQARAYGAEVIPIAGSRDDVAQAAQDAARQQPDAMYASHNWHPVFVEGVKTWALEVWEQLGQQNPDRVFVPTGGGSALVGAWRGFSAVTSADRWLPRLIACQPAACSPIVQAWLEDQPIRAVEPKDTIAEGTRIALPSRPGQIVEALRDSSGSAEAVSEEEIVSAMLTIARRGIYIEPTAAVGVAACRRAIHRGDLRNDEVVVVHVTGHGLKATDTIARLLD
jgi:threonine synthase